MKRQHQLEKWNYISHTAATCTHCITFAYRAGKTKHNNSRVCVVSHSRSHVHTFGFSFKTMYPLNVLNTNNIVIYINTHILAVLYFTFNRFRMEILEQRFCNAMKIVSYNFPTYSHASEKIRSILPAILWLVTNVQWIYSTEKFL